jgi:hypothetical protein
MSPALAEPPDSVPEGEAPAGAEACMPCRGTGRVISRLGGEPREVTCPWCRGGGVRLRGIDAQAGRRDGAEPRGGGPEGGDAAA